MKDIYVVLNPPRCGSSCTARALQAVGIELGDSLMEPAKFNKKGYFEDNNIRAINFQLMQYLNRTQQGETDLNPLESEVFTAACNLLKNRTETYKHYGFKDPVTVKFLPFWKEVFKKLELNPHYILAIRNPQCYGESALNMFQGQMSHIEKSFSVWLNHVYSAIDKTQGSPMLIVDYDENLKNPEKQLHRIKNYFNLQNLYNEENYKKYTEEFIDSKLQNHKSTLEELEKNSSAFPICKKIYRILLNVAQDVYTLEDEAFKQEWASVVDHINENRLIYHYIEALAQNFDETLIKAYVMENSLSWRMTKPFRKVRNIFRRRPKPHPLAKYVEQNHKLNE